MGSPHACGFCAKVQLEGSPAMNEPFRTPRELAWFLTGICALPLGTLATHAQNPAPGQSVAALQAPTATQQTGQPAQARATPTPSPTPTPINWSDDPMLKHF